MAPRKPASPPKPRRVTRARAADKDTPAPTEASRTRKPAITTAVPTTTRTKAIEGKSRVTKKTETKTTQSPKAKKSNARTAKAAAIAKAAESDYEEDGPEGEDTAAVETQPAGKASRSTRTTNNQSAAASNASLAAAPRRRIRVTPLDANIAEPEKKSVSSSKPKKEKTAAGKSTTSRSKRGVAAVEQIESKEDSADPQTAEPEPKKRARGRVTKAGTPKEVEAPVLPKTRGRPKKELSVTEPTEDLESAPRPTRQTRARTASTSSTVAPRPIVSVAAPARKKVTFQDLPDEDEKENLQPPPRSQSRAVKKPESAVKGMRAKPVRKPASTKTTKATRSASSKKAMSSIEEDEAEISENAVPRVLTPKKITQVAKAIPADDHDEEDELAGAKTPIRDLSLSPKRRMTPAARTLSPVKKLEFTAALEANYPAKEAPASIKAMLSPPRRMPASPAKESFDQSPRRAPEGFTIFRAQVHHPQDSGSLGVMQPQGQAALQLSPKRGLADAITFPRSALKAQRSPGKTALLSSPARRLFSPAKQKTPLRVSPSPKKNQIIQNSPSSHAQIKSPGDVDLVMSSHFRASVSPLRTTRVYRMSEDEIAREMTADVDFDQSVLNIASPLKLTLNHPALVDPSRILDQDVVMGQTDEDDSSTDDDAEDQENGLETPSSLQEADADLAPAADIHRDETIVDPDLEEENSTSEDEISKVEVRQVVSSAEEDEPSSQSPKKSEPKPRMSNGLFTRLRQVEDDSEDELAADQTPAHRILRPTFRSSLINTNARSRLSTGIAPESASRNLGFTPLADQVQGWRAGSPQKKLDAETHGHNLFSPVAQMHVAGSVELNRQDTPGRSAQKRKSMASRLSMVPSMVGSPAGPNFFADGMAAQDFEDQNDEEYEVTSTVHEDLHDLIGESAGHGPSTGNEQNDSSEDTFEDEGTDSTLQESGELTTDLIKFTHASDTAMVDFQSLANEAEVLAAEEPTLENEVEENTDSKTPATSALHTVEEEEDSMLSTPSDAYGDENTGAGGEVPTVVLPGREGEVEVKEVESVDDVKEYGEGEDAESSVIVHRPDEHQSDAESLNDVPMQSAEVVDTVGASTSPAKNTEGWATAQSDALEMDFNVTPVRPDPSLPRYVNTVVSKVPLRPEGQIPTVLSPIKMQRKRPRSLSASNSLAFKRRNIALSSDDAPDPGDVLTTPRANAIAAISPGRSIRSAAPSPAHSLATIVTTPGQLSFSIDDFGDSTLDGIELPEDELSSDGVEGGDMVEQETARVDQDESMMTIGSTLFKTPSLPTKRVSLAPSSGRSTRTVTTPGYARSTKSSKSRASLGQTPSRTVTRTPATIKAKTPGSLRRSKTPAKTPLSSRTPLKTVSGGILQGAVVHVDVHTSEGTDASGIYVELLTSMGARCVKEWRWNPRASMAADASSSSEPNSPPADVETPSCSAVGITHVVYKDGGKRTLEKVRSAKGQVLCVGLGWVLDCEREGTWLDESAYAVDASIMPRGGSRRRKSMEPRMLVNENGSLSAPREAGRRSISAEYARGLTEEMKTELVNTPVRGRESLTSSIEGESGDVEDETEISSTYNSPAAATVGGGNDEGVTADLRSLLASERMETTQMMTPRLVVASGKTKGSAVRPTTSTPQSTSLKVDYDPRTAATPLTPYLAAKKGRELVQMSAPPKQLNQGMFDDADSEDGDSKENNTVQQKQRTDGRKFQVKNMRGKGLGMGKGADAAAAQRRTTLGSTLGFKPVVGSPLRKDY